jgi:HPr kinase/phosphorylase
LTGIRVRELLDEAGEPLALTLAGGAAGCDRAIAEPRVQQPGLALAGFLRQLHPDRLQVFGNSEVAYLDSLGEAEAARVLAAVLGSPVACVVVTNGAPVSAALVRAADEAAVPLLATPLRTGTFIPLVTVWLEERLAPVATLLGNLVEVCGLGVLVLGRGGIGKSEVTLDLVTRGHRLVADDVVRVHRLAPSVLRGRPSPILRHRMEIRGLGVIDVAALFGTLATREAQSIDLAVELLEWTDDVDRLGLDDTTFTIHDVALPLVRIPVRPGRNLALLVETAVRDRLMRSRGAVAAADLVSQVGRLARRREADS